MVRNGGAGSGAEKGWTSWGMAIRTNGTGRGSAYKRGYTGGRGGARWNVAAARKAPATQTDAGGGRAPP
jgi:hypothetical protein